MIKAAEGALPINGVQKISSWSDTFEDAARSGCICQADPLEYSNSASLGIPSKFPSEIPVAFSLPLALFVHLLLAFPLADLFPLLIFCPGLS